MTHGRHFAGATALLLTLPSLVFASTRQGEQQYRSSPSAPTERFAGEISYEFDSVLNRTTAIYRAPLGRRDLWHRIFFPPPTVHSITASYEFSGRTATHVPDSVRVMFESDQYIVASSENRFELGTEHDVTIGRGDGAVRHPLSISQRIELDSNPVLFPNRATFNPRAQESIRLPQAKQAHVMRTARASFSLCEFLSLTGQREMRGAVAGLAFTLDREVVAGLELFVAEMVSDEADRRSVGCHRK